MDEMLLTFDAFATRTLRAMAHESTGRKGCEELLATAERLLAIRAARPASVEARLDAAREDWEAAELAKVAKQIEADRRRARR